MAEESYREFMCKLVSPGCEFMVRAKTGDVCQNLKLKFYNNQ